MHASRKFQSALQGDESVSWPKGKPWNEARRNAHVPRPAWNRGSKGVSEETQRKMSARKLGKPRAKITKERCCPACGTTFVMKNNRQKYCRSCFKGGHAGRHDVYGLTRFQFEAMKELQNHVCKFCGKPETQTTNGTLRELSVDHDHETNKVRGLLCAICNLYVVGKHTLESAQRLLAYLETA